MSRRDLHTASDTWMLPKCPDSAGALVSRWPTGDRDAFAPSRGRLFHLRRPALDRYEDRFPCCVSLGRWGVFILLFSLKVNAVFSEDGKARPVYGSRLPDICASIHIGLIIAQISPSSPPRSSARQFLPSQKDRKPKPSSGSNSKGISK